MNQMNTKQVEEQLETNQELTVIDVREVDEVAAGKIPGAINIPLSLIEFRMHELAKSKNYIIVCRSGARSSLATQLLEGHGFDVTNMTGGMMAWEGNVEQERQVHYTNR